MLRIIDPILLVPLLGRAEALRVAGGTRTRVCDDVARTAACIWAGVEYPGTEAYPYGYIASNILQGMADRHGDVSRLAETCMFPERLLMSEQQHYWAGFALGLDDFGYLQLSNADRGELEKLLRRLDTPEIRNALFEAHALAAARADRIHEEDGYRFVTLDRITDYLFDYIFPCFLAAGYDIPPLEQQILHPGVDRFTWLSADTWADEAVCEGGAE